MVRLVAAMLSAPLLCVAAFAHAAECRSVATARPQPPADQGLYPVRILRSDAGPVNDTQRQEMFEGTRNNDGPIARAVFTAPPGDPMLQLRSQVPLKPGQHVLQLIEQIPDAALSSVAAKNRRWAGVPRAKTLMLEVAPGQEYALAARLVPNSADRTKANAHWEPVVWRREAVVCR
jgi:hypothetical protein